MTIDTTILDFGGIGVLALTMIYFSVRAEKRITQIEDLHQATIEKLSQIVVNNTIAITQITDVIKSCPTKRVR